MPKLVGSMERKPENLMQRLIELSFLVLFLLSTVLINNEAVQKQAQQKREEEAGSGDSLLMQQ